MSKNNRLTGRAMSMSAGLAIGGVVSFLITIAGALVLSVLVHNGIIEWKNIGYGIAVILLAASSTGAYVSISKIKRRLCLVCAGAWCVYLGILIMTTVLLFGGHFEAVGVTTGVVFAGTASALLFHLKKNERKKRRSYR